MKLQLMNTNRMDYLCIFSLHKLLHNIFIAEKCGLLYLCAHLDGFMLSVRVCIRRMRWSKLLMKALHAHLVPHMFQNLLVSFKMTYLHNKNDGLNIN